MPNRLFLRPKLSLAETDILFDWALYDLAGQKVKVGNADTLDNIDQILMQNGVSHLESTVFWPTQAAHSSLIALPGNQQRFLQQALPFAVEETIAQDIEKVHIAHGAKGKDARFPVVTVDRELFENCFQMFCNGDFPHPLKAVYLDAQMLPDDQQDMQLCIAATHILVKNKDLSAISIHSENLFPYLDSLFVRTDREDEEAVATDFNIKLYIVASQQENAQMMLAQIAQYPGVQLESEVINISEFELLCESYFHAQPLTAVNLCQGDFKPLSDSSGVWHRWRSVAVIAGLGIMLQLGVFVGKGIWYNEQADEIAQQALLEYNKVVPGAKGVSAAKLPRIIKGKLNQQNLAQSSDAGFLTLLGEAGYQFSQAKDKTKLEFKSINYNKQRGELVVEMRANTFDQLDKIKSAIVAAGLSAKISSAVQEDTYFRGRISISGS